MNTLEKMKLTAIATMFFFACFAMQPAMAGPAYPNPITYVLPDGTEITIRLRGDEWVNWAISLDNYTLLRNADGFWEYAVHNEFGDLKLSGVRTHNIAERSETERKFVSKQTKDLRFSAPQISTKRKIREIREDVSRKSSDAPLSKGVAVLGARRIPIILVGFQDRPFVRTKEEFDLLFNQPNFTGIPGDPVPGSLRDYFYEVSNGKAEFIFDVFGPYTLSQNIAFYDRHGSQGEPRWMVREAVLLAYADGADFSKYDFNGNGDVDAVHVITAGYSQAAGGTAGQSIWPHAWDLGASGAFAITLNGKRIRGYSCSNELRGTSGTNMSRIGIVIHELGHSIGGLRDFYQTNGDLGHAVCLGNWCVMAYGCYNGDGGHTPARFSAWARQAMGWVAPIRLTLDSDPNVTLPNPTNEDIIYRINTPTADEFFLLENRQRQRWDREVPASGMLIYHVAQQHGTGWDDNCVLCNPARRGIYIKQAGGGIGSNSNTNRFQDPFPGPTNNRFFTDESIPNSRSWAGTNTNVPIVNIREVVGNTIAFQIRTIVDAAVSEIVIPSKLYGESRKPVNVIFENAGTAQITAASFAWSVNDIPQTPYSWADTLRRGQRTIVTLDTVVFSAGTHTISVVVSVANDTISRNDTVTKTFEVTEKTPFFFEGFENDIAGWVFVADSSTPAFPSPNVWFVGEATASEDSRSAYISSNNNAHQYAYRLTVAHLYHDITFPLSEEEFDLYFDVRGMGRFTGSGVFDYLEVLITDTSVVPQGGQRLTADTNLGQYHNIPQWAMAHHVLPAEYAGKTKRFVFTWVNTANINGVQPPAAVDNIAFVARSITASSIRDLDKEVQVSPIQAWIANDILHIKGLTVGKPYQIYNVSGMLVYQSVAKTDVETPNLSALPRGVYIIVANRASVKIVI